MDAKKVTSRNRSARNSDASASADDKATGTAADVVSAYEALTYKIEYERGRLMSAEAILHCAVIALDERDGDVSQGPDYATLIDLARDLIRQSIDKLDSVRLKATLQKAAQGRDVKEQLAEYLVH